MTDHGKQPRKTKRIVRTPATKFAHWQKRMKNIPKKGTPPGKK
jgi:hypothetical protein